VYTIKIRNSFRLEMLEEAAFKNFLACSKLSTRQQALKVHFLAPLLCESGEYLAPVPLKVALPPRPRAASCPTDAQPKRRGAAGCPSDDTCIGILSSWLPP